MKPDPLWSPRARNTRRRLARLALLTLVLTACGESIDVSEVPDLPEASTAAIVESISAAGVPAVVNVWASWCGPCRSEAPLLAAAAREYEGDIRFIGLNVRDSQSGAKGFIAEFLPSAPIEHVFDRDGSTVADLGGTSGVPLTFFMTANGDVAQIHFGIIDERTLATQVDELVRAAR